MVRRHHTRSLRPGTHRHGEMLGAWLIVLALGAVLAALVSALPSPREVLATPAVAGLSHQLDRAALIAMSLLVWLVIAWLAGVVGLAAVLRLIFGRRLGGSVITRLAQMLLPRALRGIVVTAVGVGSLGAVAGCAPGAAAAPASAAGATMTLDLDWPVDPPPVMTTAATPPPPVAVPTSTSSGAAEGAASAADGSGAATGDAQAGPTADDAGSEPTAGDVQAEPTADDAGSEMTVGDEAGSAAATTGDRPGAATAPSSPAAAAPTPPPEAPGGPGPAVPTSAAAGPTDAPAAPVSTEPTPGPVAPQAPTAPTPAPADAASADPGGAGAVATVTVVRGDSLWSLAAAHLPPGASDVDVALTWPAWYAANRDVIGDDPSHIEPGWQLVVPTLREDTPS